MPPPKLGRAQAMLPPKPSPGPTPPRGHRIAAGALPVTIGKPVPLALPTLTGVKGAGDVAR